MQEIYLHLQKYHDVFGKKGINFSANVKILQNIKNVLAFLDFMWYNTPVDFTC